jgi:hypothetical protein
MRPAQTGQGIMREGKLDVGAAAWWRMTLTLDRPVLKDDRFVNYLPVLGRSQEKIVRCTLFDCAAANAAAGSSFCCPTIDNK